MAPLLNKCGSFTSIPLPSSVSRLGLLPKPLVLELVGLISKTSSARGNNLLLPTQLT